MARQSDEHEDGEGHGLSDALRRMLVSGIGTLLTTEDGVRALLKDLKLPKEAVHFLLSQAESGKDDVVDAVGRELRAFLATMDTQHLVQRVLQNVVLEVKAEIRFKLDAHGHLQPVVTTEKKPPARARGRARRGKDGG